MQFEGEDLPLDDPNIVDLLMGAEDFFTEGTLGCSQHAQSNPGLLKVPMPFQCRSSVPLVFAEAGPLRVEVTPPPEDTARSQDVTPATVQSSKDILSLLMDEPDLPKPATPQEPRLSPPEPLAPTAEPPCPPSPEEPAAKKQKKVPL